MDGDAAAVDADVLDRDPGEVAEGVADDRLEGVVGLGVALGGPALDDRAGEHVGVLAGAVVVHRRRAVDPCAGRPVGGQGRGAAQGRLVEAGRLQDLADRGHVVGLAVVRAAGAGQGHLAEAQLALDPEAADGQGLERLGGGAEVDEQVGIAGGGEQPAVGVGHRDRAQVPALDEPGPLDLGQDLHGPPPGLRHRLRRWSPEAIRA